MPLFWSNHAAPTHVSATRSRIQLHKQLLKMQSLTSGSSNTYTKLKAIRGTFLCCRMSTWKWDSTISFVPPAHTFFEKKTKKRRRWRRRRRRRKKAARLIQTTLHAGMTDISEGVAKMINGSEEMKNNFFSALWFLVRCQARSGRLMKWSDEEGGRNQNATELSTTLKCDPWIGACYLEDVMKPNRWFLSFHESVVF